MTKENIMVRKITFTVTAMLVLILTVFFCNPSVVRAEDGNDNEQQVSKNLVQDFDNWTIFQDYGDDGSSTFDVRYFQPEDENLMLQYRTIYKNDETFERNVSDWNDLDTSNVFFRNELLKTNYKYSSSVTFSEDTKNNYFVQFQIINLDDNNRTVSKSYTLLTYPESDYTTAAPYIVSASIDYGDVYDLTSNSSSLILKLRFNETLVLSENDVELSLNCPDSQYKFYGTTSQKYIKNSGGLCMDTIDGKSYFTTYSILTFSVKIPSYHLLDTEKNQVFNLLYSIKGVEGKYSHKAPSPSTYMLSVSLPPCPNFVKEITISSPSATVAPGQTLPLTATVLPEDAADKSVIWFSDDPDYAIVDQNGVVTAKPAGAGKSVVITATANDGSGVEASVTIHIEAVASRPILVTGITLSADKTTIPAGGKVTVKAKVLPANATTKAVTWKSSNKKYATVSSKGVVTAKKAGKGKTVTITATAKDGSGKKGTIKIKIK